MIKKKRTARKGHPWAHLEESFRILICGQKDVCLRSMPDYLLAWEQTNAALCATAARILSGSGVLSIHLASEDITQGWFTSMVDGGFATCGHDREFYPFGYVVFVGQCLNYGRTQRRQRLSFSELLSPEARRTQCSLEAAELPLIVERALNRLPLHLRNAVVSKYFEGMTAAGAAEKYGTSEANMNIWRFRGRKLLGEFLSEFAA